MAILDNGVAVNFGLGGTALTLGSTVQPGIFQSIDHAFDREKVEIKDESGALSARIWFNPSEKATITYFVKSLTATNTLADAIVQTVLPDVGTFATIATCNQYPALNKTTWEVVGTSLKGTNTTAKEVTLQLEFHAGITSKVS